MDYTCITNGLYSPDTPQAARPRAGERRLDLDPNQSVSVAAAPGTAVRCLRGRFWLTQEGHWQDHFLVAGVSYVSQDDGRIVLNAQERGSAASVYRVEFAPGNRACDARLHVSDEAIARIERDARRARAAEMGRWFGFLPDALAGAWRRLRRAMAAAHPTP